MALLQYCLISLEPIQVILKVLCGDPEESPVNPTFQQVVQRIDMLYVEYRPFYVLLPFAIEHNVFKMVLRSIFHIAGMSVRTKDDVFWQWRLKTVGYFLLRKPSISA